MHPELYLPFLKAQMGWIVLFAVVVFIGFPCEGDPAGAILQVGHGTQQKPNVIHHLWFMGGGDGALRARENHPPQSLPVVRDHLRQRMFKCVVDDFSMGSTTKSSYIDTARTISRINKVSEVTGEFGEWIMRDLFPLSIALLMINGFLYTKSPWVGGAMTVGLGAHGGGDGLLGNNVVRKNMEKEQAFLDASNHMNDKFDNIENIVFSVNEDEKRKMRQENLKYEDNSWNSLIDARNLKGVTIGLSVVTFVAVLLIMLKTLKASPRPLGHHPGDGLLSELDACLVPFDSTIVVLAGHHPGQQRLHFGHVWQV